MKKTIVSVIMVLGLVIGAAPNAWAELGTGLTATIPCGNGTIDSGEQCDPGVVDYRLWPCNRPPTTAFVINWTPPYAYCDPVTCTCASQPPFCGDGIFNGTEQCSNSGTVDSPSLTERDASGAFRECPVGYRCSECMCEPQLITFEQPPLNRLVPAFPTCGNKKWDFATIREECDASVPGNEWRKHCAVSSPSITDLRGCENCECVGCGDGLFDSAYEQCETAADCPDKPGEVKYCLADCTCAYRPSREGPYCGDGIVGGTEMCEPTAAVSSWMCPPPETGDSIAEYYYCGNDCQCYPREKPTNCHDGVFIFQPNQALPNFEECDSDGTVADGTWSTPAEEQASADAKCDEGEICLYNCACWRPSPDIPGDTPPEPLIPQPQIARSCSVKISGASSKDMNDILTRLNKRAHAILGTDTIDVFGEVGYGVAFVNIAFPDTAAEKSVALASDIKVVPSDSANIGAWALVQLGGTPPYDYRKAYFKPSISAIKEPTVIFPVSVASLGTAKAQALGIKDMVYPDLNMVAGMEGVTLHDVVSVLGADGVNFDFATPTGMKLNNFIRWEVRSAVATGKATTGIGGTEQQGEVRMPWDWPSWTGVEGFVLPKDMTVEDMYIENRRMDIDAVLAALEKRAAQWKAAGKPIDCDVALGLPYEANLNMQFMAVQNKVASGGGVDSQGFGAVAVMGEMARGAGGCDAKCSIGASAPAPGNLALFMGAALAGLGSIIAVRRRKK